MKNFIFFTLLSVFALSASATIIDDVELGTGGKVKFVTSAFFNSDETASNEIVTQGIGQVQQILNSEGSSLWTSGDNGTELNFVFDNILVNSAISFTPTNTFFQNILGDIEFYTTDIGDFGVTGNYLNDSSNITSGDLFLSGTGHPVNGFTVTATTSLDSNNGSGSFDVVDGSALSWILQNSISRTDGSFADFTFNFSADNINTGGYEWAGSADIATQVVDVNAPATSAAMAGLFAMALLRKRRKKS